MLVVFRVVLLFSVLFNPVSSTRFLPSIIWDNVNNLLCCPYNWFQVPRVDLHDILDFVCPTSKLIVKQVNYQTRIGETMNFNLFRREWKGSIQELQETIADGTIHSFCNVSHPDSVKLHTCRDGKYSSFPVKFTHFVFDQSRAKYEKYEKERTYVFYSNGDGLVSSLNSKKTKCNMLFAVHTVKSEQHEFDITYDKEVAPSKCKCDPSLIPTLPPTSAPTTTEPPTTTSPQTTSPQTTSPQTTSPHLPNTTSTVTTPSETTTTKTITHIKLNDIQTPKPTEPYKETKDNWLSVPIFVVCVVATFILGVVGTVMVFQYFENTHEITDGHGISNGYYKGNSSTTASTSSTPDDISTV